MGREIGAYVDGEGKITQLLQSGFLQIYRKEQGKWCKDRRMAMELNTAGTLTEVRQHMQVVIRFLGSCGALMAAGFPGLVLHELEKADIEMWEVTGDPVQHLDKILNERERLAADDTELDAACFPSIENRGDGKIFLSIFALQRGGGLTSKQVLLPVLKQGNFRELEVLCAHVPPWLQSEVICRGWTLKAYQHPDKTVSALIKTTKE